MISSIWLVQKKYCVVTSGRILQLPFDLRTRIAPERPIHADYRTTVLRETQKRFCWFKTLMVLSGSREWLTNVLNPAIHISLIMPGSIFETDVDCTVKLYSEMLQSE